MREWKNIFVTQLLDLFKEKWLAMGKKGFQEHDWVEIMLCTPELFDKLTVSPKVKTIEGKRVGAHSLARNNSGVKGHAKTLGWD
jgi:hypothetical protein